MLAAVIAMSCASFAAFAETEPEAPADAEIVSAPLSGGWKITSGNIAMSKNPDAKAAFKKAVKGLTGVKYEAIAVLGSQVVAGTNYAILCRSTVVVPDAKPEIKIMYIYRDLQGNAEITGFQTIIGTQLMGGFSANDGALSVKSSKTVYNTFKKALRDLDGVSYTPAVYLGSQVVAGMNYMVLCRSKAVSPGAPYQWALVTVGADLDGKASLVAIESLDLGYTDDENEEQAEEAGGEAMVGIANPWSEYKTVSEAAEAAGVEFDAPEKLGSHKIVYIQAIKGIVDVRYEKDGNIITLRKGTGTDDISGDYSEADKTYEKKINGCSVTLKCRGKGVYAAVWNDGKNSYSVFSGKALTESFMEKIIAKMN